MWQLYQTAKTFSQRPSELTGIEDAWTALQFDNAVALVGLTIENAAQEQTNVGNDRQPDWQPKYTLPQLLDDAFRLPPPAKPKNGLAGLMGMAGVKQYKVS